MERKKFIRECCIVSAGLITIGAASCTSLYYYANASRNGNGYRLSKGEFINEKGKYRKFVFLKVEEYAFPICILKHNGFQAYLMECTHRSCELNYAGGIFTCPCHGSEFDKEGVVLEGPAEDNLKKIKVNEDEKNIYVELV